MLCLAALTGVSAGIEVIMSYTALYRKFRPDTFEDVKGQNAIVTTLKNQIKAQRIGHAYLFCGTRGTGKTTVAKILAKAVNCENPQDGSPCGECAMCRAIQAQTSMNVIEIDAASNNGVDNIREIVEEVRYSPTEGRYKVYIIDEVHMLSAGAFNALLKTLEEPPSYVIFILATTEVHKIPITILSRCQRYDFKRITIDEIAARLRELVDKEQIEAEDKALRYVARAADGSLRDGLSLLDQCIAFYLGQKLTYDNVLDVLGTVDVEVFARLLRCIRSGDVTGCIRLLEELVTAGRDLVQFTVDFTWYLRNLLLVKASGDFDELLEVSSDQLVLLKEEAAACDAELLMRDIRIFSELANQMKYTSQKRVTLEVALIKLCRPEMETDYSSLAARLKKIEKQLEQGIVMQAPGGNETGDYGTGGPNGEYGYGGGYAQDGGYDPNGGYGYDGGAPGGELPAALSEDLRTLAGNWTSVIAGVSGQMKACLTNARPSPGNGNTLLLVFQSAVDKEFAEKEEHVAEIQNAAAKVIGKQIEITMKLAGQDNMQLEDYPDLTKVLKGVPIEYIE